MDEGRLDEGSSDFIRLKCTYCNKFRNEAGFWEHVPVDEILGQKENTSHCICPKCFRDNFPGEFASLNEEGLIIFKKKITSGNRVIYEIFYGNNENKRLLGRYNRDQRV